MTDARAVLIDGWDGAQGVRVGRVSVRAPGPGEVRVRVRAAGVGPWDQFTTEGAFAELMDAGAPYAFPLVLGWDLAGVVDAAGPGADLRPGTRVLGMTRQPLTRVGAQAELVTLPAEFCVETPAGLEDVDAACLPCCGLTAWQAVAAAGVEPGEWLLVIGAVGQLGGWVTQLAAAQGVRVIASVGASQAEQARALGADAVVDREADLVAAVREVAAEGVVAAFDPVGGRATAPAVGAIRDGGRLIRAVTWAQPAAEREIATHTLFVEPDRTVLAALARRLADGRLTARPTEVVALPDAADGYRRLAAGAMSSRLVLAP